jgi:adenylate cyclase
VSEILPDAVIQRIQDAVAVETGIRIGTDAAARLQAACGTLAMPLHATTASAEGVSSRQEVTVLLTDLRGFTAIAETYPSHIVLEMLNHFLTRMCEIAVANGGTIDKFMGDAVMVLFGAPQCAADDARRAVTCAVQMQVAMEDINRHHAAKDLPPLFMGAGINTGQVMAGMLGSTLHSEYTVIGNEVNLASRIEAFSLRGQVLISETTFERCAGFVATSEPMDVHVKGKAQPVRLREVIGIPALDLEIPRQDVRKSPRVVARIAFTYQSIMDKIIMPQRHQGVVLDLSYEGILAEVEAGLTLFEDIRLGLDLSLISGRSHDIYGKVRSLRTDQERHFAGIEFTSVSPQGVQDIRHLVQLLIQGSPMK